MNWKCLLVGLVLVFPGTLVSVEGRYYNEKERVARERDGLYKALYNLFDDQHEVERYNSQPDVAAPAVHKKLDTNNNRPQADVQMQEEAGAAGKTQAVEMPPEKGPAPPSSRHQGTSNQEINKAVHSPQAARQSQRASSQAESVDGVPASNTVFITVVAGCTVLAAVGIVGAGVCWYKYHKSAKAASVVDYPAYGVTGPTKDRVPSPGDRKLAHSAQMYHYQHQKQQMMALQSASSGEMKHDGSDDESVEDNDDADYTVYECPGLAPTGEMEVKNPLFCGDETPSTPANDETRPTPPEY